MDRDKLLRDVGLDLETFQAHIKSMRKKGNLHKLDVDLLQEKTRKIYDKLFLLEESFIPTVEKERVITINLPEKMPEAELSEKVESKRNEPDGTVVQDKKPTVSESAPASPNNLEPLVKEASAAPPKEEKVRKSEGVKSEQKKPEPEEKKVEPEKPQVPPPVNETHEEVFEEQTKPQSAFDLFSSSAGETIGDKLGGGENSSIADQMGKSAIVDLKQAIGINEKFLFINELFDGDLGKYNKTIEEFNSLQSKEGVNTHILELKVQYQWKEENDAFLKFAALLERKFG